MSKSDWDFLNRSDVSEVGDKLRSHGKSGNEENRNIFLATADAVLKKGENLTHKKADEIIEKISKKLENK